MLSMSKMSKIDQIYLRAVMLCMLEMSKMSKIDQIEDRSNTPKGCNAMYVEDVKDRSNNLQHLRHVSTYIRFDGMVGKP